MISKINICIGERPCSVDSGSGLVWMQGYDKVVVGVFTRAKDCVNRKRSVFVRVASEFQS